MKAFLILEDGTVFEGTSFGASGEVVGEVVFNTGMTGYQEVLTDPSYYGQIVTMTYPLIGNYGINLDDEQSAGPKVKGFVVRELCRTPSNWRSVERLDRYLEKNGIVGIEGVDTRAFTRILREKGTMRGLISQKEDLVLEDRLKEIRSYELKDPVYRVTTKTVKHFKGEGPSIALLDLGMKRGILDSLLKRGCGVYVLPAWASADEVLDLKPDGILISNGPGDPKNCMETVKNVKRLIGGIPLMGICLGYQVIALAAGADTGKMKYGHRGSNHPVKDLKKDLTYITSQNHGYVVLEDTIDSSGIEISHRSLNDGTVEGIRFKDLPAFSVQFHPEASPGPQDTAYIFDEFVEMAEKMRKSRLLK